MYPRKRCLGIINSASRKGMHLRSNHPFCALTTTRPTVRNTNMMMYSVSPLIMIRNATTTKSSRRVMSSSTTTEKRDENTAEEGYERYFSDLLLLQHLTHSTRSLGVWEGIDSMYNNNNNNNTEQPSSVWESIRALPEIQMVRQALQVMQNEIDPSYAYTPSSIKIIHTQYHNAITALERAIQIFGSYQPGGKEQAAAYALLSEFQNRSNQYENCLTTLKELLNVYTTNNNNNDNNINHQMMNDIIQIAIAKVLWYQGNHAEGKEICDSLVDEENRTVSVVARTGQAMTRLLLISSKDDVFSVRDPFRMSIKRLERMVHPTATVLAAAHLNMGIAEMVWAETVSQYNEVDAPLDAAMRHWKQGITILTKGELTSQLNTSKKLNTNTTKNSPLRSILHARLLCNMAYGMLHMNHHADYITRSLEYSSESLAIYDGMKSNNTNDTNTATASLGLIDKEGLGRTLSVLGTCYHLHGDAVMGQGLFQSALDKTPVNFTTLSSDATPLQLVEQSDTYDRYADLCSDWEEREGDATQLRQKAVDIHAKLLPAGWKDKTSIHGSLWFWTGATIQRH